MALVERPHSWDKTQGPLGDTQTMPQLDFVLNQLHEGLTCIPAQPVPISIRK